MKKWIVTGAIVKESLESTLRRIEEEKGVVYTILPCSTEGLTSIVDEEKAQVFIHLTYMIIYFFEETLGLQDMGPK